MNFDRVTKVYREESQKKGLTPLESDFWEKVNRYLGQLEADLAAARAKDPNSKPTMLLQDELRKVLQRRDQIYQFRERKLALLASQVVAGASTTEIRGLTRTESELLQRLTEALAAARKTALTVETRLAAPPPVELAATPPPKPVAPTKPEGAKEVVLHILEDVPPFAGPAGTMRLKKEDIVTLPPPLAKVLVDRGKARIVNPVP